jgi:hypothetical protein
MAARNPTTMAKRAREQAVKERRERKREKKAARAAARAATDEPGTPEPAAAPDLAPPAPLAEAGDL